MNTTLESTRLPTSHCIIYRFVAGFLIVASFIDLFIICRYFVKRYIYRTKYFISNRLSSIINGVSISSFLIIFITEPTIVVQCLICQPILHDDIVCKIHGFMCLSTGLFNMHVVVLLSCLRYLSILHKSSWFNRFLEHHHDSSVLLCAVIAISWSVPSLFNIGNRYVPEGEGFYCSLKWNDSSISSRLFIISIIFFNYILPFVLIIYSNVRVWCVLRHLLQNPHRINDLALRLSYPLSTETEDLSINRRKSSAKAQLKATANRLQRLKIDQRYALITAVTAAQYLLIWTPYACVVILRFTEQTEFLERYPFLSTLSAVFAKISLISYPVILIYTSKMTY